MKAQNGEGLKIYLFVLTGYHLIISIIIYQLSI